jgi:hypothetical protein
MPAQKHTLKANTPKLKRQWRHVRNSMEERGYSKGRAIAAASSAIKKTRKKKSRTPNSRK